MSEKILFEEFHLTLFAPRDLTASECARTRRTLVSRRFRVQLLRTIRLVVRQHRTLRRLAVEVST